MEESARTVLEWLQFDDDSTLVRTSTTDKAITHDGVTGSYGRVVGQHLVHLLYHLGGTFLSCTRSGRDTSENCTSILIRHKSSLGSTHQGNQAHDADSHQATSDNAMTDNPLYTFLIFIGNLIKLIVEPSMEAVDKRQLLLAMLLIMWFQ